MIALEVSSEARGAMSENLPEQDEARLRAQIEAYHAAALAYATVKLGLPDKMGSRRWTAEQLAAELGLSPPHLFRFLRGLSTLGICEERADRTFVLGKLGQSLSTGSPSRLGEKLLIVVEQYWRPWAELVSTLQTGTPAFEQLFGEAVSRWRRIHPEQGAVFNAYLAKETFAQGDAIIEALDLSDVKTVADIGGGYGGLLAAILQAHPHVTGILFDQPQTVEEAKPFLQSLGVAHRVAFVAGDFFAAIPVRADRYLLKSVLQQWHDTDVAAILKRCREAMPPRAKLLIIERLLPERASEDASAVMIDLHMMVINGGRARKLGEIEVLLSQAGLKRSRVVSTRVGMSIIEACLLESSWRPALFAFQERQQF
jgi:cyclopropane fatty-acyl-phospholipid synthase-like methyltransferase/AraC-like DNA-binding protein